MERSGLWLVANHFDVVAIRTNDKRRIVIRVVVRTQTRCAIVLATRLQSRPIKCLHLLSTLGHECQVKTRRLLVGLVQAQGGLSLGLSSTPYVGGPSETTATPSGSSALRKNALLAS